MIQALSSTRRNDLLFFSSHSSVTRLGPYIVSLTTRQEIRKKLILYNVEFDEFKSISIKLRTSFSILASIGYCPRVAGLYRSYADLV